MDATLGVRMFDIQEPVDGMGTGGAIGELDGGSWQWYPERPELDAHADAYEQYRDDHLGDLSTTQPAPQDVYGNMVVVLDTLLFDVLEDGVEYRYRVDVPHSQAICSDKTDDETGLVAERTVPDDRLADGMQRSADALDHAVAWIDVISPRSFDDVVDATDDLLDDE